MLVRVGIPLLLLLGALCASSCGGGALAPPVRETSPVVTGFSAERAWGHLQALVAIGPRVTGSEQSVKARSYLLDQLSKLDLRVETNTATVPLPPDGKVGLPIENLIAVIPGASEDLIILAAPYDTPAVDDPDYVGADEGASGAALLLELARVIAEKPLPYTTWIVFLDGEAPLVTRDPAQPQVGLLGSRAFASSLAEHGLVPRVRLAVVFARVGGAELRIARDLQSYRMYREEFFAAAELTGDTDAFPPGQSFESLEASHRSFLRSGLRRVVVVSGSRLDGEDGGGEARFDRRDTLERCSPESLKAVGDVTLVALDRITTRLAKIDRFSESPFEHSGEALEVPAGQRSPQPSEGEAARAAAESAGAEPAEAVAEPAEATAEPAEAVAEPAEAVAEPAEAVAEPAEAVAEPAEEAAAEASPDVVEEVPEERMVEAPAEPGADAAADSGVADGSETPSGPPATAPDAATQKPPRPRFRRPGTSSLGARDL